MRTGPRVMPRLSTNPWISLITAVRSGYCPHDGSFELRIHGLHASRFSRINAECFSFQAFFFQYSIVGPLYTPRPTTALFRTSALSSGVIFLSFWTAQILSSICPTVPAPQMATCTPGWPSAYQKRQRLYNHPACSQRCEITFIWSAPNGLRSALLVTDGRSAGVWSAFKAQLSCFPVRTFHRRNLAEVLRGAVLPCGHVCQSIPQLRMCGTESHRRRT